jgi:TPR repeat protein
LPLNREALRLRLDHAEAHDPLGLALKRQKEDLEATKEFLAADQEVPEAKDALRHLCRMTLPGGKRSAGEVRIVQDACAEFRRSLWQQVSGLKARSPDESVGVSLLEVGRVREAVWMLLHETAALSEQAQARLDTLYRQGVDGHLAPHDRRILAYFEAAAAEGLPCPRLILARLSAQGVGVPADVRKALALLTGNPREEARAFAKELVASATWAPAGTPEPREPGSVYSSPPSDRTEFRPRASREACRHCRGLV